MARAELLSKVQVTYAALAFIASLIMRFKGLRHDVAPIVLGFLTFSHPTWWESPYRGDCGVMLQLLSLVYTFFATLTLCWHIRAARKKLT